MNKYKLSKAGISALEGIARFGGNAEAYEKFLNKFPDDPHFNIMCEAIAKKDIEQAFSAAHALKGVSGNLSMTRLYDDIIPLVELLRNNSLENVQELLDPVKTDYLEIIGLLKAV